MKPKMLVSLFVMAFLLLVTVVSASADTGVQGSPNPVVKMVEFESVQDSTPADSPDACKTFTKGVNGYSITGIKVWSYAWSINWCYNGTTITSLNKWRTVWANYGWSFQGDIVENQSGGVGQTSYWHYAQGDFCFIQNLGCVSHSYPWVNQTVYGNGTYSGSAGGNGPETAK